MDLAFVHHTHLVAETPIASPKEVYSEPPNLFVAQNLWVR